jgi:hypothetical protein
MKRHLLPGALVVLSGCSVFVDLPIPHEDPGAPEDKADVRPFPASAVPDEEEEEELRPAAPVLDTPPCDDVGVPCLSDDGLVARYFMDEYAGSSAPNLLFDTSADSQALVVSVGDGLEFLASNGQGGIGWPAMGSSGGGWGVGASVSKTLERFADADALTIEAVVDVQDAEPSTSTLFTITGIGAIRISLAATPTDFAVFWGNLVVGRWAMPVTEMGRVVLHLVIDSTLRSAEERVRLHVNGEQREANTAFHELPEHATLNAAPTDWVIIGGISPSYSVRGSVHYMATYDAAMTLPRVERHAWSLFASDDRPGL